MMFIPSKYGISQVLIHPPFRNSEHLMSVKGECGQVCMRCRLRMRITSDHSQQIRINKMIPVRINILCVFWNIGVSINGGTLKWMVYNGKTYQHG